LQCAHKFSREKKENVSGSQRGETANLFRLRIWRADDSSASGRSEGSVHVVLTAVDPPTPAAFLHALAAMQAL
jgi:hypothetical protein